jgi:hypothetical protein
VKRGWAAAIALGTGLAALACTPPIHYTKYDGVSFGAHRPPRSVASLKVVSGDYSRGTLVCDGPSCDVVDEPEVVGVFKVAPGRSGRPAAIVDELKRRAAAAGCDILDLSPPDTLNGRGELLGRPLGGACLMRPPSQWTFEGRQELLDTYPESLAACAASVQSVPVEELRAVAPPPDGVVTVRGRLVAISLSSTLAECGRDACCNFVDYGYALRGPSGGQIRLETWQDAPGFEKECDADAARWLPTLTLAVTGTLGPGSPDTLTAQQTCRLPNP